MKVRKNTIPIRGEFRVLSVYRLEARLKVWVIRK
jgi:hypothetical protein